jgi:hypothetical protein
VTIRLRSVWLRTLLALALLAVALFGAPQAARADWLIRGDTIPADEVVDNDVIITGSNVRVDGTVNGEVIVVVLGLGAIWLAFLDKGEPAPQVATESE